MKTENLEKFMKKALNQAEKATFDDEVPVGAVIVCENKIISAGRNRRESRKNALLHAEIEAINKACKKLGRWRLFDCTLFVTLEPCLMCAGAMINARIKHLVYGADEPKFGSCGSVMNVLDLPYNHKISITSGILKEECAKVMKDFFVAKRLSLNSKNC